MKKLLLLIIVIFITISSYSQNLPVACGGSLEYYGVNGNNSSIFEWEIEGGQIIENHNDTILVEWDNINDVGILKVKEFNIYGCEGEQIVENIVISLPDVDIGLDREICENDSFEFTTYYDESYLYEWQNGSNYNYFIAKEKGDYWVNVIDENGCSLSDTASLIVNDLPDVDLGNDTTLCYDEQITLNVSEYGLNYNWFNNSIEPHITLYSSTEDQVVWVEVVDENGCIGKDTIIINSCGEFIIPNTITPNNDGFNDTWVIEQLYKYPDVSINVYNRWGEMVYKTNGYDSSNYWDGRDKKGNKLPIDTYYYVIEISKNEKPIVGTITIIR